MKRRSVWAIVRILPDGTFTPLLHSAIALATVYSTRERARRALVDLCEGDSFWKARHFRIVRYVPAKKGGE